MELVKQALRAGRGMLPASAPQPGVIVAGGGGALGAAVLEALLASRAFAPVRVLVTQDFHATVQGLETQDAATLGDTPDARVRLAAVVFDRPRHVNGREAALLQPQPEQLLPLAIRLLACGVRHLIVVMPHDSASLPQALKAGLATLDEQAVAALGFDHVALLRTAQRPDALRRPGLQRVADLVLAQLRMMVPQREQPVRAAKVAALVVALAKALPDSSAGTRVMAPEWVWQAAQDGDLEALVNDWLGGAAPTTTTPPRMRL
ncbi:hypothetical protein [uncultured Piscinibacter sp.]|uniref:hypothetical protein n=1 Tax=uncultured Piscinibacter sp. TaxID=1131835 RepID=UPI00260B79BA|nr:hypothetical protein [uncultured Piscinibacter sp.]